MLDGYSPMVMGTLDPRWRVRRISVEVTDVLGFAQEDCVGVPVLDAVHPMDAPTLLSHMTSLALDATAGSLHLRVRRKQKGWQPSRVVVCSLMASKYTPFAFALSPLAEVPPPATEVTRKNERRLTTMIFLPPLFLGSTLLLSSGLTRRDFRRFLQLAGGRDLGSLVDCLANANIGSAAAQVSIHGSVNVLVGRLRRSRKQRRRNFDTESAGYSPNWSRVR